ncbi:MAG: dicarboxylate/amino acid:cation symporter [Phycisphaeraceae bacterium]|nr:dicarboxylate/amino acid:cation symporter [Phycisphaerales bacterium]MCB9844077.1 dicarboxylate/amino acid:cation symporter [Phycisphaeraceae bacterium]
MSKRLLLTILIFAGLILGALIGQFMLFDPQASIEKVNQTVGFFELAGKYVFIRPLMLIVVPLVFTSVLTGVVSIGDPKKLGLLGGATLGFYVITMLMAVGVGVTLGATTKPGVGIDQALIASTQVAGEERVESIKQKQASESGGEGIGAAWKKILDQMIPDNFLKAGAEGQALSIITATMLLGIGLVAVGDRAGPFVNAVESLHEALMTLVRWIIWLMPIGVMFLMAGAVGRTGIHAMFASLAKYVVVVIIGLGIHAFITLPVVLFLFTKTNPYKFIWNMRPALLMAFGTASSMATLPVTIETARDYGGCSKRATGLVLPLGATVNMDGTALYQGIAVIFMFQAFGYELHLAEYLVIVLTATLSAVGAAGVPGGSLATIMIIIAAVNTTLAGTGKDPLPPEAIGLIIGVDRILDMCRTMVNVLGDSVGARIITRLAPDLEESRERAFA